MNYSTVLFHNIFANLFTLLHFLICLRTQGTSLWELYLSLNGINRQKEREENTFICRKTMYVVARIVCTEKLDGLQEAQFLYVCKVSKIKKIRFSKALEQ